MGVYTQQKRGWRHSGACNVYTMHSLHLTVTACDRWLILSAQSDDSLTGPSSSSAFLALAADAAGLEWDLQSFAWTLLASVVLPNTKPTICTLGSNFFGHPPPPPP